MQARRAAAIARCYERHRTDIGLQAEWNTCVDRIEASANHIHGKIDGAIDRFIGEIASYYLNSDAGPVDLPKANSGRSDA